MASASEECPQCCKRMTRTGLRRHLREVHNEWEPRPSRTPDIHRFRCRETSCELSYETSKDLRSHLTETHGLLFESESIEFETSEEFEKWKRSMEKETKSYYCRKGNIYYCNRSYRKNAIRPGDKIFKKRQTKPSCKMEFHCTSTIRVINNDNGLKVIFHKTHYGHDCDVKYLRIPKDDRIAIASKLMQGMPPAEIFDDILHDMDANNSKRIDFLTTKDVRNIKKQYKITTDSRAPRKRPVPKYSGRGDPDEWFKRFEAFIARKEIEEPDKVMPLFLEGAARDVYLALPDGKKGDTAALKAALVHAFGVRREVVFRELLAMRWSGEPVAEFSANMRRLMEVANVYAPTFHARLFVAGLPEKVQQTIHRRLNQDEAEDVETVLNAAEALLSASDWVPVTVISDLPHGSDFVCSRCHRKDSKKRCIARTSQAGSSSRNKSAVTETLNEHNYTYYTIEQ